MPPSARAFATRATSVGERARIAGSVVIAVVFLYALFGGVGHKLTGTRYGEAPHIVNLPSASLARTPSATRAPLCSGWATPGAAPPEDAASCPPPEWGAKYANYQADDLIRVSWGLKGWVGRCWGWWGPRHAWPTTATTARPTLAFLLTLRTSAGRQLSQPPARGRLVGGVAAARAQCCCMRRRVCQSRVRGGWLFGWEWAVAGLGGIHGQAAASWREERALVAPAVRRPARTTPAHRLLPPYLLPPARGCNVWAFCADYASGCGECFPQAANHAAPGPESAKFGRYGGCTADGTYPYGTCSLKKAADPSSPKPAGDGDYDSWISGARAAGGGVAGGGAGGDTASGQAADAAGATDIIPEADAHAKPGAGAAGGAHTVKTAAEKAAATGVGKGAADEWP